MTRKSNQNQLLPVDEEFHRYFKSEASKRGLTIKKFGQLIKESDYLGNFTKIKEGKNEFKFKIKF